MKLNTNIYVFNFVLLLSFFRSSEANPEAFNSNLLAGNACAIVDCGQGTCRVTNNLIGFGFECDCNSGWTQFHVGPIVLPPCIIPSCTLNFGCGAGGSEPPTPPPPKFNVSDPCSFTWCGDGSCKTNGTGYECDCNAGSDNLLDKPVLPCFKDCSLGGDCHGLGHGAPAPSNTKPPPPNPAPSPSDTKPLPLNPAPSDTKPPPPDKSSSSSHGVRELSLRRVSWIGDSLKVVLILGVLFL